MGPLIASGVQVILCGSDLGPELYKSYFTSEISKLLLNYWSRDTN